MREKEKKQQIKLEKEKKEQKKKIYED